MNLQLNSVYKDIQRLGDKLGAAGRDVAKFILANPEEVALLPAGSIAKKLGISESTVVRFAKTLGFDGYPALRRAFQEKLRRELDPSQRLAHYQVPRDRKLAIDRSFEIDIEDVAATAQRLQPSDLAEAVDFISAAPQVYVIGLRGSYGLAYTLYHQLSQTIRQVKLMDPGREGAMEPMAHLGPKDVLIAISLPRYTRMTIDVAAVAARLGARVIAITDQQLSPLAQHAAVTLTAQSSPRSFANANVGALSLINALVEGAVLKNRKSSVRTLARLEKVLDECKVLPD